MNAAEPFGSELPTLSTERLRLRPFTLADVPAVEALLRDGTVARTILSVKHPYPDGAAAAWISSHGDAFREGRVIELAIEHRDEGALVGAIMLAPEMKHFRAVLGYWLGPDHWGRGYATEAARAIVAYGFDTIGLQRIYAFHFADNPASGRVLEKLGMQREGVRRQHTFTGGRFRDSVAWGVLKAEWQRGM